MTPTRLPAASFGCLLAGLVLAGCGAGGPDAAHQAAIDAINGSGTPSAPPSLTPDQRAAVRAANAFAELPPKRIEQIVDREMSKLHSMHISGRVPIQGNLVSFDVSADTAGNCSGTAGIGAGRARIEGVAGQAWLQADEAYIEEVLPAADPTTVMLLRGRWIVAGSSDTPGCDLDAFLSADGDRSATLRLGRRASVRGQDTISVQVTDSSGTARAFVRTSAPHYLVRDEGTIDGQPSVVDFSDFGVAVHATRPPDDQIIDPSRLSH